MRKLVASNDRVIVKPLEEEEQTYGNIIVPDMGKEKPEIGTVIDVGPGRHTEFGAFVEPNSKIGQKVLIPKIGSIRVDFEGEEYYIVPDKEILAFITDEE